MVGDIKLQQDSGFQMALASGFGPKLERRNGRQRGEVVRILHQTADRGEVWR